MNEPVGTEPSLAAAVRLRPMTAGDIVDSAPLLAQLGYPMKLDELARRVLEVQSTPRHLLLVAETSGRLAGLVHAYVRRRSKIRVRRWCKRWSSTSAVAAPASGAV